MELLKLIRENFSTSFTLDELQKFMMKTCGVEVSYEKSLGEGDLYLFKYCMISANWSHPATAECRGTILRHSKDGWSVASRPFDKFFNISEGRCPLQTSEGFKKEFCSGTLDLREKKDGSCIQVWYDGGVWRASTLGTITPQPLHNGHEVLCGSLGDLFWKLLGKRPVSEKLKIPPHIEKTIDHLCENWTDRSQPFYPFGVPEGLEDEDYDDEEEKSECEKLCHFWADPIKFPLEDLNEKLLFLDSSLTYIFELCSTINVIVTQYEEDHVSFLGARNNETGEVTHPELPGVNTPWSIPLSSDLCFHENLWKFVEKNSTNPKFGKNPEGFVITKKGVPIAKLKNSKYLILHKYGFNDPSFKKKIIRAFHEGILDDIYQDLTPEVKKYADSVSERISLFMRESSESLSSLKGAYQSRKDFALAVSKNIKDDRLRSFCFNHIPELSSGDFISSFEIWVKNHKDEKFWKTFE